MIAGFREVLIVTKDSDYSDLSIVKGSPPKVIWLQMGNCRVEDIEAALREKAGDLTIFWDNPALDIIVID